MKPRLILGLGNPLMGDEGVGWHVVERLQDDTRVPADTEVAWGGTDVLRLAGRVEGRREVVLVDAMLDDAPPGSVHVFAGDFSGLDARQEHAHQLAAVEGIRLLQLSSPAADFTLLGVAVASAEARPDLSPALAGALPRIVDGVLAALDHRTSASSNSSSRSG